MEAMLSQRVRELVEAGWEPLTTTETTASLAGRRPFVWWLFLAVIEEAAAKAIETQLGLSNQARARPYVAAHHEA